MLELSITYTLERALPNTPVGPTMSDDDIIIASAGFIILHQLLKREKEVKKKKEKRLKPLHQNRYRYNATEFIDSEQFHIYCRMSASDFEYLLNAIGPKITRKNTSFREAIPASVRLGVTLRFLASGESYSGLTHLFKISKQCISVIVPEVCAAIIEALDDFVKMPSTTEEWSNVSRSYEEKCNFPQCLGAIAFKHCLTLVQASVSDGSTGGSKSTRSVVLLGVVDANYCFLFADLESKGSSISAENDSINTSMCEKLQQKIVQLPIGCPLTGRKDPVPYVFVADDTFPIQQQQLHILTPYSGKQKKGSNKRVFNSRLLSTSRIADNAFGIISQVFRVLRKPVLLNAEKAKLVVLTCIHLHNFLRKSDSSKGIYTPSGSFDMEVLGRLLEGGWRKDVASLTSFLPMKKVSRKPSGRCEFVRQEFAAYFVNEGRAS